VLCSRVVSLFIISYYGGAGVKYPVYAASNEILDCLSLREGVEMRLENGFGVPRPPQTPTGATPNPPAPRGRRLEGNRVQWGVGSPRCGRAAAVTGLGGT
jgi:hypothetical protein